MFNNIHMDFSAILAIATLITGLIWLFDKLFFQKKRKLSDKKEPKLVEYSKSFFPILFIVFFLRGFIAEPFRIPSGSMKPTLIEGDFILVNKFKYGIRLPVFGTKIIKVSDPKRGDVLVFRFPKDPSIDFIKRVVGVPGDVIEYKNKTLYINGELAHQDLQENLYERNDYGMLQKIKHYTEKLNSKEHSIYVAENVVNNLDNSEKITVPANMYFVMGDNRDNSEDSRSWGFVPDELILGKAFMVWLSFDSKAKDVRWNRIGKQF